MDNQNKPKKPYRTIAKVKNENGRNGQFQKLVVENPYPANKDGSPNPYHKGVLLWVDNETGKHYHVKQGKIGKVTDGQAQAGFTASIYIDLSNTYDVDELKQG